MNIILRNLKKNKYYPHQGAVLDKFRRKLLIITGPMVYLLLALLPWFGQAEFVSQLQNSYLPNSQKFTSFWGEKRYQVGKFRLEINTKIVKLRNGLTGFQSTTLRYENFSLHWAKNQPLVLIMPSGQEQEFLPTNYRRRDDGVVLEFPGQLQLSFRSSNTGLKVDLLWPRKQEMPSEVRLPWTEEPKNNNGQSGNQLQVSSDKSQPISYLSSFIPVSTSAKNYLGIELQYFAVLDVSHNSSIAALQGDSLVGPVSALGLHRFPLLWQESQLGSRNTAQNLYQKLYQAFYSHMLYNMNDQAKRGDIPNPEWIALYLKLVLEQNAPQQSESDVRIPEWLQAKLPNYEEVRQKMQAFAKAKSWESLAIAPYLGIDRNSLAQSIRSDDSRIDQVENSYYLSSWSFAEQKDLAQRLFDYGYLKLLLLVTQHAMEMQLDTALSNQERFYVLSFLWQVASHYPRNGIVTTQGIYQQFRSWLAQKVSSWERNSFPEGISVLFILDLLQALWDDKLQLQEQAYTVATQLFKMMDSQGNLPKIYQRGNKSVQLFAEEDRLPYSQVWQYMTKAALLPRNITVVPGFWLWSTGRANVSYVLGQPILATVSTFPAAQGNKLLLLRGVYFYPEEVLMNGKPVEAANQIPQPQLGNSPAWYYDSNDKYLAIEMPAIKQETVQFRIR